MILRKMIPDIDRWNLYLLGTDINMDAIEKANKGIYTKFSFRQTPELYKGYFKPSTGELLEIDSAIKKMVHLKYHNIINGTYSCLPPNGDKFDLILIKNVLIYFDVQKAKTVVDSLFTLLKDDGYLATTPAEYSMGIFDFANSKCSPDGYIIQKLSKPKDEIVIHHEEPEITETIIENLLELQSKNGSQEVIFESEDKYSCYHNALEMLKNGDNHSAKTFLHKAIYLDKDFIMAHIVLANILKKEKKFQSAIRHINNAKAQLAKIPSQEVVEFSDGIMAADLLFMLNFIKGDMFE
jgi:chemotaxis protein methyltransferase CheR